MISLLKLPFKLKFFFVKIKKLTLLIYSCLFVFLIISSILILFFLVIDSLRGISLTFKISNDLLCNKGLGLKVREIDYWCNINKCYNYNVMHSHGRSDLIGIYYVQVPPGSGNLHVLRNDGSQYCDLYENRADMLEYVIEPEMGRLYILPGHLWHYVTGSNSDTDRVSVSFNIYT